ncbi:MAG: hypothetical protein GAK37_00981 [Pseudomonas sp.]|nr:MAG: hypothetical protein GAK37_00981 [Pseudomonas sp.]
MTIKPVFAALLLGALNLYAVGAHAEAKSERPDIQQVLSVTEDQGDSALCSIVNSHLTYLDSHGQQHVFDYRKFSSNCLEGS